MVIPIVLIGGHWVSASMNLSSAADLLGAGPIVTSHIASPEIH